MILHCLPIGCVEIQMALHVRRCDHFPAGESMLVDQDQRDTPLELAGVLDINSVAEVRKALLEHVEQHARISLDLSRIQSFDAAGVQLLLAMQRSAEAVGKPFAVVSGTDVFTMTCEALGISRTQFVEAIIHVVKPACNEKETTVA